MKKRLRNSNGLRVKRCGFPGFNALLFVFSFSLLLACGNKDSAHEHDTYTCPMHPTVISDRPSTCPVCGMDLVRKARPGEEVKITEDLKPLLQSPNETVVASIKTIKGEYKSVPITLQALGIVTYDTRYVYTIPARIGGRLEKVTLKYAFQPVQKGQKVAEIYSPELLTAQRELLYLIQNDPENTELISSSKRRLKLLGATDAQIEDLIKRKETSTTFSVYSPYSGYLIAGDAQAPAMTVPAVQSSPTGGMGGGMGMSQRTNASSTSNTPSTNTSPLIREGNYVSAGQTLFKIVNSSALRIELDLPASEGGSLKAGNNIELDFGDGEKSKAKIDFVQPFFSQGEDFIKLRVYSSHKDLHIGHLVNATIHVKPIEALWVPKESVLDLGVDKVVFIKARGVFKPQKITTGVSAQGLIEVKQGLSTADEIASNAQFMIDSESFIKVNDTRK